ncbi:hypothetical protein DERP_000912 [Dermatophagoides pteronyssinus]|uniref:Uncharacterized protein n=1 Tax=Dermatophagoides pteronyssinus TaxID=6956 RepID=A0ABQ8JCZ7_DERPT|nr:hypothetical protein DERP_000912 [Dermatophagoides pteronyssinus]
MCHHFIVSVIFPTPTPTQLPPVDEPNNVEQSLCASVLVIKPQLGAIGVMVVVDDEFNVDAAAVVVRKSRVVVLKMPAILLLSTTVLDFVLVSSKTSLSVKD